jgi:hypothetical protein
MSRKGKRLEDGIIIQIQLNFELEKEILCFGEGMKVVAPKRLRKGFFELSKGLQNYES